MYKHTYRNNYHGFTIVELLIVIVIIALLATVTVIAFNGIQDRAREAKINQDIATITKAIMTAREAKATTLQLITGDGWSPAPCEQVADYMQPAMSSGPKTVDFTKPYIGAYAANIEPLRQQCWTAYKNSLAKISAASGIDISAMVDPWGAPYSIDENEGKMYDSASGTYVCNTLQDTIALIKPDTLRNNKSYFTYVPSSGYCNDLVYP